MADPKGRHLAFTLQEKAGALLDHGLIFCGGGEHRSTESDRVCLLNYAWDPVTSRWTVLAVAREFAGGPEHPELREVRHASTIDALYDEAGSLMDSWGERKIAEFVRAMATFEKPMVQRTLRSHGVRHPEADG